MTTSRLNQVVRRLRRAALRADGAGMTDAHLLSCFIEHRDEPAFAAIVRRHGPMVWGVCRRLLHNHQDAEDAFQAALLVLARKAASIVPREGLANWLHGVALRTALRARVITARRRARERQVIEMPQPAASERDLWTDLQPLLDRELNLLPDKYRVAIIVCDLEGKTRKEAARQLGCPEGTVAGRLARARVMLAKRLRRRGLDVSGGALAIVLSHEAALAAVPPAVMCTTITAATLFAAGPAATGSISARVAALTEGVLKSMLLSKLKMAVVVLMALAAVGSGAGGLLHHVPAAPSGSAASQATLAKQDKGNLKETVLALEKRIWEAHATQDVDTFKNLLADDFVGMDLFGKAYDKAGELDYVSKFRVVEHALKDVRVVLLNGSSAIVTYEIRYKVRPTNGQTVETTTRHATSAWAQRDGRWWYVYFEDRLVPATLSDRLRNLNVGFQLFEGRPVTERFCIPVELPGDRSSDQSRP
jgi:RNA polymerase sigma factor (sigma-70 family)